MAGLGDLLAGIGGHGPDRPALEAFVANSQATNAYRSAQTEQAFTNARKQSDEAQSLEDQRVARAKISSLATKAGLDPDLAELAGNAAIGAGPNANPEQIIGAFLQVQKLRAGMTLGDPTQLGTPAATAAGQVMSGKPAEPVAVPDEFTVQPGMPNPVVQQTPRGAAQTNAANALGALHDVQAARGGFNPNTRPPPMDDAMKDSLARRMAAGVLALPNAYAMGRNPDLADIANRAFAINPALSQADQPTMQATEKAFTQGVQGRNIAAINTAVGHVQTLHTLLNALQASAGSWDNPYVQRVANFMATQTGGTAPTSLQAALSLWSPEITKSTVASGAGAEEERTAAQRLISASTIPAARDALNVYAQLLASRSNALETEYQSGGGQKHFKDAFLRPETKTALGLDIEEHPSSPQSHAANAPTPGAPTAVTPPPGTPPGLPPPQGAQTPPPPIVNNDPFGLR